MIIQLKAWMLDECQAAAGVGTLLGERIPWIRKVTRRKRVKAESVPLTSR